MSHFVFQSDSSDTTISNVTLVENHVQKHIHLENKHENTCDKKNTHTQKRRRTKEMVKNRIYYLDLDKLDESFVLIECIYLLAIDDIDLIFSVNVGILFV